jgi:hypothetical protein
VRSIKLTDEVHQTEGWETRNEGGAKIGEGKTEVRFGIIEVKGGRAEVMYEEHMLRDEEKKFIVRSVEVRGVPRYSREVWAAEESGMGGGAAVGSEYRSEG